MRFVTAAMLVCACRSSDVTPDTAPLAPAAVDLPAWFGAPGSRRVKGTLVDRDGRPLVGTVHLRADVPDATIWAGIDRVTAADGQFAFEAPRRGRYTLFATAPGVTSRVVDVDVRNGDADVTVFAFPCATKQHRLQSKDGVAITGARVAIGGTVVAHTDARGVFSVCASKRPLDAALHASGFAAERTRIVQTDDETPRTITLLRAIVIHGRVFDAHGHPAANVGVQPAFVDQVRRSHGNIYVEIPLVVTSDARGQFVFRELAEVDAKAGSIIAAYTARSIMGDDVFDHFGASFGAHADGELVLRRERFVPDAEMRELDLHPVTWKLRGRVVRGGRPVPDAEIIRTEINFSPRTLGFSRADGTFDVDVHEFGRRERYDAEVKVVDVDGNARTFHHADHQPEALFELPRGP
jgi:hypothetical protein